jgi:hypothetical protein
MQEKSNCYSWSRLCFSKFHIANNRLEEVLLLSRYSVKQTKEIIQTIKDKSCLFIYYPSQGLSSKNQN